MMNNHAFEGLDNLDITYIEKLFEEVHTENAYKQAQALHSNIAFHGLIFQDESSIIQPSYLPWLGYFSMMTMLTCLYILMMCNTTRMVGEIEIEF